MDPDAALKMIRAISKRILHTTDNEGGLANQSIRDDAVTLSELVQGLDEWITKGGFLPADWRKTG